MQSVMHLDTFWAGIEVIPVTLGMLIASPLAGSWSSKVSARVLSTLGLGISAAGLIVLMLEFRPDAMYLPIGLGMGFVGFGSGLFLTPNTRSIMTAVPAGRRGFANGLRSMLQNMGQVLSTAISLTIVTAALPRRVQDAVYAGSVSRLSAHDMALITNGYRWAFFALLVATGLGMGASLLRGKRRSSITRHAD